MLHTIVRESRTGPHGSKIRIAHDILVRETNIHLTRKVPGSGQRRKVEMEEHTDAWKRREARRRNSLEQNSGSWCTLFMDIRRGDDIRDQWI